MFLVTVRLLIVGSVIGALAPSFGVLLTGRIVQAIGTGMLIPVGMNITIQDTPLRLTAALFVPVICGSALVIGPVQTFAADAHGTGRVGLPR